MLMSAAIDVSGWMEAGKATESYERAWTSGAGDDERVHSPANESQPLAKADLPFLGSNGSCAARDIPQGGLAICQLYGLSGFLTKRKGKT